MGEQHFASKSNGNLEKDRQEALGTKDSGGRSLHLVDPCVQPFAADTLDLGQKAWWQANQNVPTVYSSKDGKDLGRWAHK